MLKWKEIKQDDFSLSVNTLDLPELEQTLVRVVSRSTQYDNKIEAINEFLISTPKASKSAKLKADSKPKSVLPKEEKAKPAESEKTKDLETNPKKGPGL